MKPTRSILLLLSAAIVASLVGGGLAAKVGSGESAYHQVVVFSEILNLVLENYVDPVDAEKLLGGAYEGMLGGLDAHGAYLTPEEVEAWKKNSSTRHVTPGLWVLKAGHALQVVAVAPESSAEQAGVLVGDQIRAIDGRPVRDLSLDQAWMLLEGPAASTVKLDLLQPSEGFRRKEVELVRDPGRSQAYAVSVERGIGVVRLRDISAIDPSELGAELEELSTQGVEDLLLDLRNVADSRPREAARAAGLFVSSETLLRLRDRSGRLTDVVALEPGTVPVWNGRISLLVNGATAGSAEALASVIRDGRETLVLGESTYGLGAEPKLFEMKDGSGLLVSSALWETGAGNSWNDGGIEPDEAVRGKGKDYAAMIEDQLRLTLDVLEERARTESEEREAA